MALTLNCHDVVDEASFDLPDLPEAPQRYLVSETNLESGDIIQTVSYEEEYIATRSIGSSVYEYDYSAGELVRERVTHDRDDVYDTDFTHEPMQVEWIQTGFPTIFKKVWTSPDTYEETVTDVRAGANRIIRLRRYTVEDHKPISRITYRIVNGEEIEEARATYFYKEKVLNPYFGRYGKDIFQPLWLHTRLEEYHQRPNGEWFLSHESQYEYEVGEDLLPLAYDAYFRDHDTPGWRSKRSYQYR